MPLSAPAAASLNAWFTASLVVSLRVVTTKSMIETVTVGTRRDMPSKRPFSSGMTRASARAAPVVVGMMFAPEILVHLVKNALVVGVGVDRVHQAALDAEGVVQYFGCRSQAVRCTGGVGDDIVLAGIVHIFVDAEHNRDILAFGRSRDNYFLRTAAQVGRRFLRIGEKPCGLDDELHTQIPPGNLRRVALRDDLDVMAVDDKRVLCRLDSARKTPVGRVVLQQVSVGLCIGNIVDRNDLDILRVALKHCLQGLPSDAPEAVDAYTNAHMCFSPSILCTPMLPSGSGFRPHCLLSRDFARCRTDAR